MIITPDTITPEIWDSISRFPGVYIVNGSPLQEQTLLWANILNAHKAVILGHDTSIVSNINNEMLDAQSVFIYKAIKKVNPQL